EAPYAKEAYSSYIGEGAPLDFTYKIAAQDDNGITTYTEFDFYLPKEGSGITVLPIASRGGSTYPGCAISISTAGISSWRGNTNYELIYGDRLDCGKWYSMQLVFDYNESNIQVIVTDENSETVANQTVGSRSLNPGYYRTITFNPSSITTGGDDTVTFPAKEPSMAETYITNLRVYNRATIKEFYPEGTTADESGNAIAPTKSSEAPAALSEDDTEEANGTTYANNTRLGSRLESFVRDQVENGATINIAKTFIPEDNKLDIIPPAVEDKTFVGWKLIYSNGDGADIENGVEGTDATRLKYAAVYKELDVAESFTSAPDENNLYYKVFSITLKNDDYANNYQKIRWTTFNNGTQLMSGIWNLDEVLPEMTNTSSYTFGHVVYNIPTQIEGTETNVTVKAQALNEAWTDADDAAVSDGKGSGSLATPKTSGSTNE
ncbi:MAG: hypothetical protein ACI4EA_07395, partial [Candidatus Ornithomonoglobus sp.]